jgi:hypothetical protein
MDDSDFAQLGVAIFWLLLWIVSIIITYRIAKAKGLNIFWPVLFTCLQPLPLLWVLLLPANKKALEQQALKSGVSKKCPRCAEIIRAEAHTCPFCRGIV